MLLFLRFGVLSTFGTKPAALRHTRMICQEAVVE